MKQEKQLNKAYLGVFRQNRDASIGRGSTLWQRLCPLRRKGLALGCLLLLLSGTWLGGCSVAQGDSVAEQEAFERVIAKGWMTKQGFRSNAPVTRGQAIQSIVRMAQSLPGDLPAGQGHLPQFQDTAKDPNRAIYLQARNCGILRGGNSNKFFPDKQLLKMDCITWLDRTFDLPDTVDFQSKGLADNDKKTDPEAYYAINKYLAYQIIRPDGKKQFHPRASLTMGQFAVILDRLSAVDGIQVRKLALVQYEGQPQKQKIIDPADR